MPTEKIAYSIKDFAEISGVCIQTIYNEINAGRLQTYNVGRRRFISRAAAEQWQHDRENEAKSEATA